MMQKEYDRKYNIEVSKIDYVIYQLSFILTSRDMKMSRGRMLALAYFIVYEVDAIPKMIEANIRYSKKSIENDITDFRKLGIMEKDNHNINKNIKIYLESKSLLINFKVV